MLTLEDFSRFVRAYQAGSYLGLGSRQTDSGHKQPRLHTTKASDTMPRYVLAECAHHMTTFTGPDTDFKHWGLVLAERGGKNAKKRAAVAVVVAPQAFSASLAPVDDGEIYEPLRNARLRGRFVPMPS